MIEAREHVIYMLLTKYIKLHTELIEKKKSFSYTLDTTLCDTKWFFLIIFILQYTNRVNLQNKHHLEKY